MLYCIILKFTFYIVWFCPGLVNWLPCSSCLGCIPFANIVGLKGVTKKVLSCGKHLLLDTVISFKRYIKTCLLLEIRWWKDSMPSSILDHDSSHRVTSQLRLNRSGPLWGYRFKGKTFATNHCLLAILYWHVLYKRNICVLSCDVVAYPWIFKLANNNVRILLLITISQDLNTFWRHYMLLHYFERSFQYDKWFCEIFPLMSVLDVFDLKNQLT